jgi:hypothetical protein
MITEEGEDDDSYIGSDSGDSMDTCCYHGSWQASTAFVFVQDLLLTNKQLDAPLLFSEILRQTIYK